MSKSLQKKLIKDAQIAQKKLAKGGGAAAANTQSSGATGVQVTKATKGIRTIIAAATGSSEGIAGSNENELVSDFIAALESGVGKTR